MNAAEFEESHPVRRLVHQDAEWEYRMGGLEGQAILLLGGAEAPRSMYSEYILDLEQDFVAIAPTLAPQVDTIDGAIDGLLGILDEHQIDSAHIFGHSQGGYLAQELGRRNPDRIRSLILSGTCLPGGRHYDKLSNQLKWVGLLPDVLLPPAFRLGFWLAMVNSGTVFTQEQRQRLWDEVAVLCRQSNLRQILGSSAKIQIEFHNQIRKEEKWRGPVLLIETDNDGLLSAEDRTDLRLNYSQGQLHELYRGGHFDVITRPGEFLEEIRAFIVNASR